MAAWMAVAQAAPVQTARILKTAILKTVRVNYLKKIKGCIKVGKSLFDTPLLL
jgi:hypothetical protein